MSLPILFIFGFSSALLSESLRISPVQDGSGHKLLVNTHVAYGKVLDFFVSSLNQTGFKDWQDVIVVVGASEKDKDPYVGKGGMTFIETIMNNQDVTAWAMLARLKEHPLVHAKTYFSVQDTTTLGPCFPNVFQAMKTKISVDEVVTAGDKWYSFISAFGREVIDLYGHNFDTTLDKHEIVDLESKEIDGNVKGVKPLPYFAKKWTILPARRYVREVDLYGTGYTRREFYYRDFDVSKLILWGAHGDMTGGLIANFHRELVEENKAPYFAEECPRQEDRQERYFLNSKRG